MASPSSLMFEKQWMESNATLFANLYVSCQEMDFKNMV